MVQKKIKLKQ